MPTNPPLLAVDLRALPGPGGRDVCVQLTRDAARVRLQLMACFDERGAEQLSELVDWLLELGPPKVDVELVDGTTVVEGATRRRLSALALVRRAIEQAGGSLTVLVPAPILVGQSCR